LLEDGILNENHEKIVLGSLYDGIGFGNSSTTLGHALSYVYSNEGIAHGHALAFTTTIAHEFNKSKFYERFLAIIKKLELPEIILKQNLEEASERILSDRKHLDNNPTNITKKDIIQLLKKINDKEVF
jgi:succinate semialdehyde reductase